MSRVTKIWLIIAASLVLLGCILFGCVMAMQKWDFEALSTNKYETNNYELSEEFKAVSVDSDTADIKFVLSENSKATVECYERKNLNHTVEVTDGTLVIKLVDTRKWYEHIGINFGKSKITVYLPEAEYSSLEIEESTGDIEIPDDFSFDNIDISVTTADVKCYVSASESIKIKASTGDICVKDTHLGLLDISVSTGDVRASGIVCDGDVTVGVSTGKVYLTDVECQSVESDGGTGDIFLKDVIAAERFSIERSTGDVSFEDCDAAEIFVETDTGDVEGSLLSEKVFIVNTDTGEKDVPNTVTGGKCEITTDTGDIKITIN